MNRIITILCLIEKNFKQLETIIERIIAVLKHISSLTRKILFQIFIIVYTCVEFSTALSAVYTYVTHSLSHEHKDGVLLHRQQEQEVI